jgi:hypothetical protein
MEEVMNMLPHFGELTGSLGIHRADEVQFLWSLNLAQSTVRMPSGKDWEPQVAAALGALLAELCPALFAALENHGNEHAAVSVEGCSLLALHWARSACIYMRERLAVGATLPAQCIDLVSGFWTLSGIIDPENGCLICACSLRGSLRTSIDTLWAEWAQLLHFPPLFGFVQRSVAAGTLWINNTQPCVDFPSSATLVLALSCLRLCAAIIHSTSCHLPGHTDAAVTGPQVACVRILLDMVVAPIQRLEDITRHVPPITQLAEGTHVQLIIDDTQNTRMCFRRCRDATAKTIRSCDTGHCVYCTGSEVNVIATSNVA